MSKFIHHTVAKKAAKEGVTLIDQGHGVFMATDTRNGNKKTEGTDATKLLADVLAARAPAKAAKPVKAPKAAKPAKAAKARDEDEESDGEDDESDGEDDEAEAEMEQEAEDDMAAADEGDEEELEGGSIVKSKYRAVYAEAEKAPDSNDDDLAVALHTYLNHEEEFDTNRLATLCRDNDIDLAKHRGRNNGHTRMIIGNMLRAKWRKGTDIKVGTGVVRGLKPKK